MVSRAKGLTMMLKDSDLKQSEGQAVEATLKVGETPFTDFSAQVLGPDEIGIFPQHGAALAAALEKGVRASFQIASDRQFRISSTGRRDPLAARLRPPQRHRDRAGRAMTALVQ